MNITEWTAEVRALFPVAEEFELAAKVYAFATAFDEGMSPLEAYQEFDKLAAGASA